MAPIRERDEARYAVGGEFVGGHTTEGSSRPRELRQRIFPAGLGVVRRQDQVLHFRHCLCEEAIFARVSAIVKDDVGGDDGRLGFGHGFQSLGEDASYPAGSSEPFKGGVVESHDYCLCIGGRRRVAAEEKIVRVTVDGGAKLRPAEHRQQKTGGENADVSKRGSTY